MITFRNLRAVYWGVEYDPRDRRRVCRSWLVEDQPPWRKSIVGLRGRIGRYGIHLGLCRTQRPSERPWRGQYVPVSEIRNWRGLSNDEVVAEKADGEAVPAPDEVRSSE
jgi:hypothetical protein